MKLIGISFVSRDLWPLGANKTLTNTIFFYVTIRGKLSMIRSSNAQTVSNPADINRLRSHKTGILIISNFRLVDMLIME